MSRRIALCLMCFALACAASPRGVTNDSGAGGTAGAPASGGAAGSADATSAVTMDARAAAADGGGMAVADAGVVAIPPPAALGSAGQALVARLARLHQGDKFLFGQQNATLWGLYREGRLVSTNSWFDATARANQWTSDAAAVVGDHAAVLGVSVEMLAFEPASWNRRALVGQAMRRHLEQGGVVTMDWHATSCGARARTEGTHGSVTVDGKNVTIHAIPGGTSFYAEEEYTRPSPRARTCPRACCACARSPTTR